MLKITNMFWMINKILDDYEESQNLAVFPT